MTYDDWKSTEPQHEPFVPLPPLRCIDCAWRGSSRHAFEHHRTTDHHRLMLPNGLMAIFSCCDHEATGMPLVARKDVA